MSCHSKSSRRFPDSRRGPGPRTWAHFGCEIRYGAIYYIVRLVRADGHRQEIQTPQLLEELASKVLCLARAALAAPRNAGSDLTDAATAVDELRERQISRAEAQPGAGADEVGAGQHARGARHGNVVKSLGRREIDRVLPWRAVRAAGHEEMCGVQSLQPFHHRPQFEVRQFCQVRPEFA